MRERLAPILGTRWTERSAVFEDEEPMVKCDRVLQELSNYIDDDVDPVLRQEIEEHLRACRNCSVLVDSTRKMLYIVGDERIFGLPIGYSDRLRSSVSQHLGI